MMEYTEMVLCNGLPKTSVAEYALTVLSVHVYIFQHSRPILNVYHCLCASFISGNEHQYGPTLYYFPVWAVTWWRLPIMV